MERSVSASERSRDERVYPFDARPTDNDSKDDLPSRASRANSKQAFPAKSNSFRARLSMPDTFEINRMRDEFLEREPHFCFSKRHQPIRVELYLLLEEPASSKSAKYLSIAIFASIILSIAIFMLETMPELNSVPDEFWLASEGFFTLAFMAEYIVRLLVCDVSGTSPWTFIRTPMNVVDVVAILPFFVILALNNVGKAIGFIRAVRLVRLFRIFKLGRYSTGLKMMMVALSHSGQALSVLVFFLGIGSVLFSSVVYHVEKLYCPDQGSFNSTVMAIYKEECSEKLRRVSQYGLCCNEKNISLEFPSILSTFWWAIVTMSTCGYGDVIPRTSGGKLAGAVTMCSGILFFALPIALIGSRFQEAYNMAMSRGGPSLQVRKRFKDRDEKPFKIMSTRLRLLRFSNTAMTRMAKDLSKELAEASDVHQDIRMFERTEKELQRKVLLNGIDIVKRLQYYVDSARAQGHQPSEPSPKSDPGVHVPESEKIPEMPLPNQPDDSEREAEVPARMPKMVSFTEPRQGG